jgi:hypothetical protein
MSQTKEVEKIAIDPNAKREAALGVVRRALDENTGTQLATPPAAPPSFEVLHPNSGTRAVACVIDNEVCFLRAALPSSSSSSERRTGWFRVSLPTLHVICK